MVAGRVCILHACLVHFDPEEFGAGQLQMHSHASRDMKQEQAQGTPCHSEEMVTVVLNVITAGC